ncbi:hypothetical protein JCM6882_004563 [Rhodosporidiobolus microsporus]
MLTSRQPTSRSRLSATAALSASAALLAAFSAPAQVEAAYNLTKNYEGGSSTFFGGWEFYNHWDNLTNGDVDYIGPSDSVSLAYTNDAGHTILKVDNTTTVTYPNKRKSVRIESRETFPIGSMWIYDLYHVPYGCSVWPSAWSSAPNWPQGGEIDTFEGVNQQQKNRMALHTADGCTAPASSSSNPYSGNLTYGNCFAYANSNSGCGVEEPSANSYGEAFAANGGGMYVTEMARDGVKIWFFERANIPADLSNVSATPDPSSWPEPSMSVAASSCEIPNYFAPQHLVFTITLCGDWAGNAAVLNQTGCPLTRETCYVNYVLSSSNYDQAYFEIASVRVYFDPNKAANSSDAAMVGFPSDQVINGQETSGAAAAASVVKGVVATAVLAVAGWTLA